MRRLGGKVAEDFHFHDLRHPAGTCTGEAGADLVTIALVTIAAVLGHSDLTMAARYTHPTDRGVRKAVEAVSGRQQKNCHNIVRVDRERKRKLPRSVEAARVHRIYTNRCKGIPKQVKRYIYRTGLCRISLYI